MNENVIRKDLNRWTTITCRQKTIERIIPLRMVKKSRFGAETYEDVVNRALDLLEKNRAEEEA